MEPEMLARQAAHLLSVIDPTGEYGRPRRVRPYMIELFGTPKAGKSTIKEKLKHFFRRNDWRVSTPAEGAEIVELPRDEPEYNLQTLEYALSFARHRRYDKNFHLVIFDRAVLDGVARMEYYRSKGVVTAAQQKIIEGYCLLPWNRGLFDLHICMVCEPEIAIERELSRAITKKHGHTMNPATLAALHEAHRRVWRRHSGRGGLPMIWHDSSKETVEQTAVAILDSVLSALTAAAIKNETR